MRLRLGGGLRGALLLAAEDRVRRRREALHAQAGQGVQPHAGKAPPSRPSPFPEKLTLPSPQGPCCTEECSLKVGDKCRDDNGCRDVSFCDGAAPACPMSALKPNKTVCNQEFVCYKGVSE